MTKLFHSMSRGHQEGDFQATITITYQVPEGVEPAPVFAIRARELAQHVCAASEPAMEEIVRLMRAIPGE